MDDILKLCGNLNVAADAVAKKVEEQRPVATAKEAEEEAQKFQQVQASLTGAEQTLQNAVANKPELAQSPAAQNTFQKLAAAKQLANKSATLTRAIADSYQGARKRSLQRIQLCWVIDGTCSMEPHIEMVKDYITRVTKLLSESSSMLVSVGYVVYRDHNCGDRLYSVHDFSDATAFVQRLQQEPTLTGRDYCEECFGGLMTACTKLSWSPEAIVHPMVWVGDAPQHGFLRGGYPECDQNDLWPKGHPNAPSPQQLADEMARRAIHLIFLKITDDTDFMISEMNKYRSENIDVHEMAKIKEDPQKWLSHFLRDSAMNSSTNKLSLRGSGGSATVGDFRQATKVSLSFDPAQMTTLKGTAYTTVQYGSSNDELIDSVGDFSKPTRNIQPQGGTKELMIAPGYFSCGGIRYARGALLRGKVRYVAKDYRRRQDNTLQMCLLEMRQTLLADVMAATFCSKVPNIEFSYVSTFVMEMDPATQDPPFSRCFAFEEYVEGEFGKFNSNYGCVDDIHHPLAQCFTHYTFQRSGGKYMICDLQGWQKNERSYKLTDPAVLTKNPEDFPVPTNMGQEGMDVFFRAHKCNDYCKALGLTNFEFPK